MKKYKNKYRIPSARHPDWDYGANADYFVTICTHNHQCFFGKISNGIMMLSDIGEIVRFEWVKSFEMRPDMNLIMFEYVVMPNHFHAIIGIGKNKYKNATSILILADGGGSNSSRHHVVKESLQNFSNDIGIELRMAHYPPYTSKWNPIEHRVFPHITRALEGGPLKTIYEAKNKIESAKTKTGLTVVANIFEKTYEKGKEVAKHFIESLKLKFGESLPKLNYTISPVEKCPMGV